MSIFKKTAAVKIDKMGVLTDITLTEESVEFHCNYSTLKFKVEEIPKLLADVMQLYVYVKPTIDKKQANSLKNKAEELEEDSEELDLSEIPF